MHQNICEHCQSQFSSNVKRRFCSKPCWHSFNRKSLIQRNKSGFCWETATEEQKRNRVISKFEKHVIKKDGCWDWSGSVDKDGYPNLCWGAGASAFKIRRGARISWWIYKGEIPDGMILCHTCDNVRCTNPEHLFLGSYKDNSQDMAAKGRAHKTKLNPRQVDEIINSLCSGVSRKELSKKYNVCLSTIDNIKYKITFVNLGNCVLREKAKISKSRRKSTKLSLEKAREIRNRIDKGEIQARLAVEYGVSEMTISAIKKGKIWIEQDV